MTHDPEKPGFKIEVYDLLGDKIAPHSVTPASADFPKSGDLEHRYVVVALFGEEGYKYVATPVDEFYRVVEGKYTFPSNFATGSLLYTNLSKLYYQSISPSNYLKYIFRVTTGAGLRVYAKGAGKSFLPFMFYRELSPKKTDEDGYDVYEEDLQLNFEYEVGGRGTGFLRKVAPVNPSRSISALTVTVPAERIDPEYREAYESKHFYDSVYFNVNDAQHLALERGDTFKILPIRVWQAQLGDIANYFIEPDYHIEVFGDTSAISRDWAGRMGCYYDEVKALAPGVAVLKYAYDPIVWYSQPDQTFIGEDGETHYSLQRSEDFTLSPADKEQYFNSINPIDTGIVVVHVLSPEELAASDDVGLETNITQREYDTIYYDRERTDHAEYAFRPSTEDGGEVKVRVHRPIHLRDDGSQFVWGKGWSKDDYSDGVVSPDAAGGFTVKLYEGRSVIEVSSGVVKKYHVVHVRGVKVNISNKTNPGSLLEVGDTAEISFDGLQLQLAKIAGIYNPGFPSSNRVRYKRSDTGEYVESAGTQYSIADPELNKFEVEMTGEELRLTEGSMPTGMFANFPLGGHRTILEQDGIAESQNASEGGIGTYCTLPDITIRAAAPEAPEEPGGNEAEKPAILDEIPGTISEAIDTAIGNGSLEGVSVAAEQSGISESDIDSNRELKGKLADIGLTAGDPEDGGAPAVIVDGELVANREAIGEAIEKAESDGERAPSIDLDSSVAFPIVSVDVEAGKEGSIVVLKPVSADMSAFAGDYAIRDVALVKLDRDKRAEELRRVESVSGLGDGSYIVTDKEGRIALGGETIEAKTYLFIISIKDDGVYDWDETPGSIYDPVILGVRERSEPSGGSGGADHAREKEKVRQAID
ncbi:MAG: hypothetical protein LBS75_02930 [Synergistaceae bacterium]|jgi:hypothetical protein|nr:hypothetical protein [Synergistaceae bacterium]